MLKFIEFEDGKVTFTKKEFKDLVREIKKDVLDTLDLEDAEEIYNDGFEDGYDSALIDMYEEDDDLYDSLFAPSEEDKEDDEEEAYWEGYEDGYTDAVDDLAEDEVEDEEDEDQVKYYLSDDLIDVVDSFLEYIDSLKQKK